MLSTAFYDKQTIKSGLLRPNLTLIIMLPPPPPLVYPRAISMPDLCLRLLYMTGEHFTLNFIHLKIFFSQKWHRKQFPSSWVEYIFSSLNFLFIAFLFLLSNSIQERVHDIFSCL